MKSVGVIILLAVLVFGPFVQAAEFEKGFELAGNATVIFPEDDENFDQGYGLNGQVRYWFMPQIAVALGGGFGLWEFNDDPVSETVVTPDLFALTLSIDSTGDLNVYPLGGSVLVRTAVTPTFTLVFEGGVYYVIADSDIEFETRFTIEDLLFGGSASESFKDDVDVDDGIVGVVGVDAELVVIKNVTLFAGGGYQFDIDEGDASISSDLPELDGLALGENSLEGFFARAGAKIAF